MADQNIDEQLMSIISGKLMFDEKYLRYRYNNKEPSAVLDMLIKEDPDEIKNLIKEAEESRKIINDDKTSFSTMMKTSFSDFANNLNDPETRKQMLNDTKATLSQGMDAAKQKLSDVQIKGMNAASDVKKKATEGLTGFRSALSNRFGSNKHDQNTAGGKRKSRKQKKSKKSKKNKSKKSKK